MITPTPLIQETFSSDQRWFFAAIGVVALFIIYNNIWWVPVQYITDQRAYVVAARQIADTGSPAIILPADSLPDPLVYRGAMLVNGPPSAAGELLYPKYPLGVPFIYALFFHLGGESTLHLAICVISGFALMGAWLLMRQFVGSLYATGGLVVLAASYTLMRIVGSSKSHGASLAFVCFGFWMLTVWYQRGTWWRAALAGLLLGYGILCRYLDGVFILPALFVCFLRWQDSPNRKKVIGETLAFLFLWSLLPLLHSAYMYQCLGYLTGYDTTGESTSFAWKYLVEKTPHTLTSLFRLGLTLLFPLGLLALPILLWRRFHQGLFLALSILPILILYTAYYWWSGNATEYTRLFTPIYPFLIISAVKLIVMMFPNQLQKPVIITVLLISAAWNFNNAIPLIREEYIYRLNIANLMHRLDRVTPPDATVMSVNKHHMAYLDISRKYHLVRLDGFSDIVLREHLGMKKNNNPYRLAMMRLASLPVDQRRSELSSAMDTILNKAGGSVYVLWSGETLNLELHPNHFEYTKMDTTLFTKTIPNSLPSWVWNADAAWDAMEKLDQSNGFWTIWKISSVSKSKSA